jgi:mRNA-degrading endonuclease RelE of RelBE toxin-antitoxin system
LRRLPGKVATAVIELVYGPLASNPSRVGRPLRFALEGVDSAHRGDYRVVYRIDQPGWRVEVLRIGHRADVYRRDWPVGVDLGADALPGGSTDS